VNGFKLKIDPEENINRGLKSLINNRQKVDKMGVAKVHFIKKIKWRSRRSIL